MRYFIVIVSKVLFLTTLIKAQRQGDLCVMAGTIQPGVCRHVMRCPDVLESVLNGLPYQVCASPEDRLIVCCPWVPGQEIRLQARSQANITTPREGDNCTMVDTGKAGVCSQFGNCQTAIEAASKGIPPQVCALEGTVPIVCCPLVTVAEGDQCTLAGTGQKGKCLRISKCPAAVEAALKGITPQICALDGSVPAVCCEGIVEGDRCTMVDTGRAGVCSRFANCQTAKEAAYKGISPQICAFDDRIQLIVCCPPVTVIEGDNCIVSDTGKAGVCRPLDTCQKAKKAASKGISPQTCDVEGAVQIVCCPMVTVVEGDNCTMVDSGSAGVCTPFANCHSAKKAASRGILQQKCDLTNNESELVCCTKIDCPPLPKELVTQLPIGSKAADYCIELAEKIHPCKETSSGWTRGDLCPLLTPDSNKQYHTTRMTTAAEAPYSGRIGSGQRRAIFWRGYPVSLVSDQWVLCSARGLTLIGSNNVQFVGLGANFTPNYKPDETYGVLTQHIHPLFKNGYSIVYNDIALLRLDRVVTFTARIMPACLHTGTPLPDSGFILTGVEYATFIHYKTSMQRLSQEECSRVVPTGSTNHPAGVKHDVEICSRPVNKTGACMNWFSGSPLTLPNSHRVACTHLLVGLFPTWFPSPCTNTNTLISGFIPWIESIVWPESDVII